MILLARGYYKGNPDVEWQQTDDGTILIGERSYGDFGEGIVERLRKKELIENIKHYASISGMVIVVWDQELQRKLKETGIPFVDGYAEDGEYDPYD